MYRGRGFALPGCIGGASAYLAQHDFLHVLADYGTNLPGELEVFTMIGRADPDPKGFAWVATLVGLFGTGYVESAGFFDADVKRKGSIARRCMCASPTHCVEVGTCARNSAPSSSSSITTQFADQPIDDVRHELGLLPKSERCAGRRFAQRVPPTV